MTLTKGRKLPCKGGVAGVKAISFIPWQEGQIVGTDGELATFPSGISTVYRYMVKNSGNTYSEEISADAEARTVVYNGTLNVVLHKATLFTRNQIKMLAMGEVVCFIEMYNGDVLVQGAGSGANVTGGTTIETGGNKTDFTGAKITVTSSEEEPYLKLSAAAKATYIISDADYQED
jgi:hypothetical protein